ncbi:MAG: cation:proton antiporter [Treponema sp.]|nr:cation:proton antiporter [Treponema sp.]
MEGVSNSEIILQVLLAVGVIVMVAKFFGLFARKIGIPEVAGMIVAGLLLRFIPWFHNFGGVETNLLYDGANKFISELAEIGVILIMFSAGLSTNLKSLIKSGGKATAIACAGVFVPLIFGTIMSLFFFGFDGFGTQNFYKAMFIGTILTATSVSISVAVLKEFGKIKTDVGQTIVSAAIIDDVIGIIVLTIVLGVSSGDGGWKEYLMIIVKTILFFVCAIAIGFAIYKLFQWYDTKHPRSHRIPIYALGIALIFAYCAERFFGIADITGAYIAGIVLCSLQDASYMESKIDINSYMLFSPIFFASIGLKTDLSGMTLNLLWFAIAFVIIGCISKIIGCGGISKALGYTWKESYQIGLGMMVRGEVALIVATKGLSIGLIESKYFTAVILLIIVSSMLVPVLLKRAFMGKKPKDDNPENISQPAN